MRFRIALIAMGLVLVAAAGCTGGEKPVSASGPKTVTSRAAAKIAGMPRVMVQLGTNYADGTLVQYCKGDACQRGPARPSQTLKGNDPMLFIVDQKPLTARAELRAAGAAEPLDAAPLHVGTTMLYAPKADAGYYLLTMTATWKGRSGSWVFRVQVPRD